MRQVLDVLSDKVILLLSLSGLKSALQFGSQHRPNMNLDANNACQHHKHCQGARAATKSERHLHALPSESACVLRSALGCLLM